MKFIVDTGRWLLSRRTNSLKASIPLSDSAHGTFNQYGHNVRMPNIAALLKSEITRIARKQVREETQPLRTAVAPYRSEIAALKRRAQALEQQIKKLTKAAGKAVSAQEEVNTAHRFSAKGMATNRQRLGVSAADFGKLLDASALSVYKWEKGEVRPREKHVKAIAAIRSIGKKEALARLKQLA